jgi:hypothetical protein
VEGVEEKYKEVMEWVKFLEGMWGEYKDVMEINWELGMGMVKLLERTSGEYKDVMEIN